VADRQPQGQHLERLLHHRRLGHQLQLLVLPWQEQRQRQLQHRQPDNYGSGPASFPHWGGSYCGWTSTVQQLTGENGERFSGIRGLDVNLRWKEYGNKRWWEHIEVEINSCQNADMDHHCSGWSRAHYHADDSSKGWAWWNDSDDEHVDIENKDMFYQVRIHMDSSWGWNGYAVDKLEVKAVDCE